MVRRRGCCTSTCSLCLLLQLARLFLASAQRDESSRRAPLTPAPELRLIARGRTAKSGLPTRGRAPCLALPGWYAQQRTAGSETHLRRHVGLKTNAFCSHSVSLRRGGTRTPPSACGAAQGAPRRRRGIRSRAVYDHVTRTPDVRYTASTRSKPHRSRRRRAGTPTPRASSSSKHWWMSSPPSTRPPNRARPPRRPSRRVS